MSFFLERVLLVSCFKIDEGAVVLEIHASEEDITDMCVLWRRYHSYLPLLFLLFTWMLMIAITMHPATCLSIMSTTTAAIAHIVNSKSSLQHPASSSQAFLDKVAAELMPVNIQEHLQEEQMTTYLVPLAALFSSHNHSSSTSTRYHWCPCYRSHIPSHQHNRYWP